MFVFSRAIRPSIVLIVKAFKGQLKIPEFKIFTDDIEDIYNRYMEYLQS